MQIFLLLLPPLRIHRGLENDDTNEKSNNQGTSHFYWASFVHLRRLIDWLISFHASSACSYLQGLPLLALAVVCCLFSIELVTNLCQIYLHKTLIFSPIFWLLLLRSIFPAFSWFDLDPSFLPVNLPT